jgi:hypothetical protein
VETQVDLCLVCGTELRATHYVQCYVCANGHVHTRWRGRRLRYRKAFLFERHDKWRRSPKVRNHIRVRLAIKRDKSVHVHKLVAQAWLPPQPSPKHVIRHLNGDQFDNRACNLAWGTHKDNADDRRLHGRSFSGESNPRAKLTEADVRRIRVLVSAGARKAPLGREYGVSAVAIGRIARRQTWSHIA